MKNAKNQQTELKDKFPLIVKYCNFWGSHQYWIEEQLSLCQQYSVPSDTYSIDKDGKYSTADDIKSLEMRHWMGLEPIKN